MNTVEDNTENRLKREVSALGLDNEEDVQEFCRMALDFGWSAAKEAMRLKAQGKINSTIKN